MTKKGKIKSKNNNNNNNNCSTSCQSKNCSSTSNGTENEELIAAAAAAAATPPTLLPVADSHYDTGNGASATTVESLLRNNVTAETAVVKPKSSCCSNGKCSNTSKTASNTDNNTTTLAVQVDDMIAVYTSTSTESDKVKSSCCSKGKCSSKVTDTSSGTSSSSSNIGCVDKMTSIPVDDISTKPKSSCCSKGKCSSNSTSTSTSTSTGTNTTSETEIKSVVPTTDIIAVATSTGTTENSIVKSSCCSKGKCSSSKSTNTTTSSADNDSSSLVSVRNKGVTAGTTTSKPKSSCCSKGKCSKSTTTTSSNSMTDINTINSVIAVDDNNNNNNKQKSCCSKGKCSSTGTQNVPTNYGSINNPTTTTTTTTTTTVSSLIIAVVQENGTDVVVFDTNRVPRTFHFYHPQSNKQHKLCFDSHGCTDNGDNCDMLSPCFDEYGLHGNPIDPCFCGVETAHLHAHIKNSTACTDGKFLASHILYPVENDIETLPLLTKGQHNMDNVAFHLSESQSMPNQCNSKDWSVHTKFFGNKHLRRVGAVGHDTHIDNLIHNTTTNQLHLQYPCHDCGNDDVHGRFRSAGKRRIRPSSTSSSSTKGQHQKLDIHVHFFEIDYTTPFKILDYLSEIFDIHSDRVDAVDNILDHTSYDSQYNNKIGSPKQGFSRSNSCSSNCKTSGGCGQTGSSSKEIHENGSKDAVDYNASSNDDRFSSEIVKNTGIANSSVIVRSTIECTKICCASEIPIINSILSPLSGVTKVLINVPLKKVSVDHDVSIISANQLADKLNIERMGATVERDGGAVLLRSNTMNIDTNKNKSNTVFNQADVRSQFHVQNICCASEIPAINKILNTISGVRSVKINTTTKIVFVDHDIDVVSAQALSDALSQGGFGATIRQDAAVIIAAAAAANSNTTSSEFLVLSKLQWNESTIVEPYKIHSFFQSLVSKGLVQAYTVDVQTFSIDITHNPLAITILSIAEGLKDGTEIDTVIGRDGSDPMYWKFPISLDTKDNASTDKVEMSQNEANRFNYPRPAVVICGILWLISLVSLLGDGFELFGYAALFSVAFGIPTIAMKAIRTLRRFQFDTNCLMLFAALGALGLQVFEEAAAVVFLFVLSEWLEVRATTRARMALSSIVQLRPETANIVHPFTGEVLIVPAEAVPVGVIVSIRAGDKVPCDGIVVSGTSTIDESSLTGESRPIQKGPDDTVSSGTINSGKSLLAIRTTATSENSAVARLIRLVEEAQTNRSETEMMVDKFAKVYTPIVVIAAVLMCSIPWAFGKEIGQTWTKNGLVLIVVACPCALIISTPVAYVAGLAAAAQNGVLIKGGAYLESLSKVRYLCFDKTGTLTNGIFSLLQLNVLSKDLTRNEVFQYLVVMEDRASHPIAQAILTAADNEKVTVPTTMILEKHTIIEGEGVGGVINGLEVFVGNERMFQRLNLLDNVSASEMQMINKWKNLGGTIGFMSVEGYGIVCAFCAADGIRSEAQSVVEQLRKLGISIFMLTGDNDDAAEAIGRQIGLSGKEIKSKLLPEEKLNYVKDLVATRNRKKNSNPNDGLLNLGVETRNSSILSFKQEKLVLMCGDGVNDAPALAASDVGVAMGAGATIAMESADVTLLDSNLEKLSYSIRLGRHVTNKILQNVAFSIITKLIVVGFALSGRTKLWAAICADVGAMLVVTLNAMTILPRHKSQDSKKSTIANDSNNNKDPC